MFKGRMKSPLDDDQSCRLLPQRLLKAIRVVGPYVKRGKVLNVASPNKHLPLFCGTRIRPSGILPSKRLKPWGSSTVSKIKETTENIVQDVLTQKFARASAATQLMTSPPQRPMDPDGCS
ncbi:hypothetical protein ACJJTC_017290, partial [Scirpophaga incertulas]